MSGGWGHITKADGTPYDDSYGVDSMLETTEDVVEALEECYGMIWGLARIAAVGAGYDNPSRQTILQFIEMTRSNCKMSVDRGRSGN